MNSTNDSPNPGNPVFNLLKRLGNFLLMLIVTPFMLANEFRQELSRDVYSGFAGGIRALAGGLFGFAAAGGAGHYFGWTLEWRTSAWLSLGVLAWFATYCYLWPLFYLFPVKPAIKLAQLVWDGFRDVAKKYADQVFGGIVRTISKVLPASSGAWNKVLGEKKNSWVCKATIGLAYPISIAGCSYTGFWLFKTVAACFSSAILGNILGVGAGLLVGLSLLGVLWQLIEEGKMPFVAVALAIGLDRVFSGEIGATSSALHLTGYLSLIGHTVAMLAFVGYFFPLVTLALSGGLLKWLVEQLKPICERAYDDRDKDYIEFFHNTTTLVVSAIVVLKAFSWAAAIALPIWALAPALAAVFLFAYLWVYDVVDHGGGTFITGAAASVYTGWFVGSSYFAMGLPGGFWMASPVGIFTALVMGACLFPVAYLIVKPICVTLRISKAGKPLNWLHKQVEDGCHKVFNQLMHTYDASYRDRSGYQVWFLQAANLASASLAAFYLPAVLSSAAVHTPALLAHLIPVSATAVIATQVSAWILSYLLVGRFLLKSNVGTEFIGALSSLALAVWLCSNTVAVGSSWATTIIVGVLGWITGFFLAFPIAYLGFRFPARYLLASWSTSVLVKLHDFAWSCFAVVWDRVEAVYKVVDKAIFMPIRNAVAAASHKVSDVYTWLRNKILRRK